MVILDAIKKLESSNKEQKIILEQIHEQFNDLRKDSRYQNLPVDDLEELFLAYLKTWINTNSEVIQLLTK